MRSNKTLNPAAIFHLSGKTLQLTFSNMLCVCIWVMDAIIYMLIPFQLQVVYQDFFKDSPSQSRRDWVQIENVHKNRMIKPQHKLLHFLH